MNYEKFKSIMIEDIPLDKLPEEQLLNKMKEKPERFLSDFQLQDDSSRFMKILVTSSTIRLGRAFEKIIKAYFEKNKYTNMEEEAKFKLNSKKHEIDILVSKNNDILVIEQKIRDDHDKGKKENILKDLKLKWNYIKNKNNTKNVKGILYFVDPILQVNKNHYEKKLQNIRI